MSKHTPGPWFVDNSRYEGSINRMEPFRHIGMVSSFLYDHSSRAENDANAKLMAAAPDLLAALEGLMDEAHSASKPLHKNSYWSCIARAAIARALGES